MVGDANNGTGSGDRVSIWKDSPGLHSRHPRMVCRRIISCKENFSEINVKNSKVRDNPEMKYISNVRPLKTVQVNSDFFFVYLLT